MADGIFRVNSRLVTKNEGKSKKMDNISAIEAAQRLAIKFAQALDEFYSCRGYHGGEGCVWQAGDILYENVPLFKAAVDVDDAQLDLEEWLPESGTAIPAAFPCGFFRRYRAHVRRRGEGLSFPPDARVASRRAPSE
jgi:hypothetical protein